MQSASPKVRQHRALDAMFRAASEVVISGLCLSASVATRHQVEVQEVSASLRATTKWIGCCLSHFPTHGGLPPKALRLLLDQLVRLL